MKPKINLIQYDFNILEEAAKSEIRGMGSQFVRLYNHMLKYKYQRNLQSRSWTDTIKNASKKLSDCSKKASLWDVATEEYVDRCYISARLKTIDDCVNNYEKMRLEHEIPSHITAEFAKEECINLESIKTFCRTYVNTNLPDMVEVVDKM